mmetsp:Transcript_5530/g.5058  ORF Transcript_5530/g.5058 Transcript_5530/m.5058 type:complete len:95 (-) Transcript_5530:1561-1845(-)
MNKRRSKDFKIAYTELTKKIIKKTLRDQEQSGRDALLISEKDLDAFDRRNHLEKSTGQVYSNKNKENLKAMVAQMMQNDIETSQINEKSAKVNN